jgi:hypothetical protein
MTQGGEASVEVRACGVRTTQEHIMNTTKGESSVTNHPVVSHEQWVAERTRLLAREKELTHLRDQVARERRALPWVRIDKAYTFDTPEGARSLIFSRGAAS